jgi:hypothetical protein
MQSENPQNLYKYENLLKTQIEKIFSGIDLIIDVDFILKEIKQTESIQFILDFIPDSEVSTKVIFQSLNNSHLLVNYLKCQSIKEIQNQENKENFEEPDLTINIPNILP